MKVLVETSAHHVHLSQEDFFTLFGNDAELTNKKDLSQPGQFVCFEKVDVVGPRNTIKGVSLMGPARKSTQVEISLTEARKIGLQVPVRESGCIDGTPGCKLVGPKGEIEIKNGVIAAKRHIHLTPEAAKEAGVKDKQIVSVKVTSDDRSLIFGDVVCRVSENFAPAMHVDTDESNAAGLSGIVYGEIIL